MGEWLEGFMYGAVSGVGGVVVAYVIGMAVLSLKWLRGRR